jgi:hypothetical protein
MRKNGKILITGTGRSGTTFLIKLFSFLEFDTGWNKDNYKNSISKNCNSGMERNHTDKPYILKNPIFMRDIKNIIKDKSITIKTVIIPIRDYEISAASRVSHGRQNGGLWCANDKKSQIQFFKNIIADYIYYMTKYDIDTTFIDFDRMIKDKKYLFNKIKYILDEKKIGFDVFSKQYDNVSKVS